MADIVTYKDIKASRERLAALRSEIARLEADIDSAFLSDLVRAIEPVCERYNTNLLDAIHLLEGSF